MISNANIKCHFYKVKDLCALTTRLSTCSLIRAETIMKIVTGQHREKKNLLLRSRLYGNMLKSVGYHKLTNVQFSKSPPVTVF